MRYALVVHGFREHLGRHVEVRRLLSRAGFRVVGVTLTQHGRGHPDVVDWTTWSEVVAPLESAARELPRGASVLLFGHSLGGLVVLDAVARGVIRPTWLVLSAPFLRLPPGLDRVLTERASAVRHLVPRLVIRPRLTATVSADAARNRAFFDDPDVVLPITLRTAYTWIRAQRRARSIDPARLRGVRVFLVYGARDAIVSTRAIAAFASRLADDVDLTVEFFSDEGHELLFRSAPLERLRRWL